YSPGIDFVGIGYNLLKANPEGGVGGAGGVDPGLNGVRKILQLSNFAAVVCSLPLLYNEAKYMTFLDDWGTHVIMQVDFGTKVIKRYESSMTEFINHVQKSVNPQLRIPLTWPSGTYGLIKTTSGCPAGSVLWDDENKNNHNSKSGTLPDGQYDADTRIDFCCRKDGVPTGAISLPIEKPFFLFKYTRECQRVKGMSVAEEYIIWDDYPAQNHDKDTGAHPFDDGGSHQHKLHFCYYAKSGSSLIG
ncbi:uncharacterized protein LOC126830598, partial [Patella vulgata]|uniref:uncharacterized protein LOC126830598 n=1 Tax=Patella vulgata TaxID=6465 RepID=UPI0024A86BC8